jgi:molybdopterin-guanine dinucleotide biosynthesis protein A
VIQFSATAILLAGGRSTRMGRDKRHMDVGGISLLENAYHRLSELFAQVLISVRKPEILIPGARHVPDAYGDNGPLGAVVSAMETANHEMIFVMACDIPHPPGNFIQDIMSRVGAYDVVVPVDNEGRYETLFAVYRRGILPELHTLLNAGEKRIRMVYPLVNTLELKIPPDVVLRNLNTPEDYQKFRSGP